MLFIATLCNKARELRDGGGHKMSHFILIWCTRVQHSIETNMVTIHHNGWAEAETLKGGLQHFWANMCTQTDYPVSVRAA